jgi:MurNAc alpha-1-phosphate uridylyltransferase
MRGMILAAGRGSRMGHLTDQIPKPLLRLQGKYLIEYAIQSFVASDIKEIIINISYHKEKIKEALGDGRSYGVHIEYSEEENALETGGGIVKALPLLGDAPFIVVSADVISNFSLQNLPKNPEGLAHIVLVDNPSFNRQGDFALNGRHVSVASVAPFTYSNIGIYRKELFAGCQPLTFPLGDLLKKFVREQQVTGEYFKGTWYNLGTEEQLLELAKFDMQKII